MNAKRRKGELIVRYIFEGGKHRRVMHIMKTTNTGEYLSEAICGIKHNFNRTINAPWGLGRKICENCKKKLTQPFGNITVEVKTPQ